MLYLTGQKRGMSELNLVWPVILTGIHAAVISSPVSDKIIGHIYIQTWDLIFFKEFHGPSAFIHNSIPWVWYKFLQKSKHFFIQK